VFFFLLACPKLTNTRRRISKVSQKREFQVKVNGPNKNSK
jgi:hypothetical protein